MSVALAWEAPTRESTGDAARKLKAAAQAATNVLKDRDKLDAEAIKTIDRYLLALQDDLRSTLLSDKGSLTDFSARNVAQLLHDVDRMVAQAQRQIASAASLLIERAAELGSAHAADPLNAAGLQVVADLPGLDHGLIEATINNTAHLLTQPMQQFRDEVQTSLRAVANAGEGAFGQVTRLRNMIDGAGFDNAQYRAERIIRTEVGRTFNSSSYTRLEALSNQFPFIRKCWRDSDDSRVRLGHQEAGEKYARGSGIAIADPFEVSVYTLRRGVEVLIGVALLKFPVDPDARPAGRVAAGATIMCRCNSFIDFEETDYRSYSRARISAILDPHRPAPATPSTYVPGPTVITVPDSAHPGAHVLSKNGGRVPLQ